MKYLIFLALLLIEVSCTYYGITNDKKKLTVSQREKIVKMQEFKNLDKGFIYELNASTLKKEMALHSKSLVYVFTNACKSTSCLPLSNYVEFAKFNNYELFLVMSGYANLNETVSQNIDAHLFSIDSDYYRERKKSKYVKYFWNDLEGLQIDSKRKEYKGSLYFFEGDSLVKILTKLPNY